MKLKIKQKMGRNVSVKTKKLKWIKLRSEKIT